MFRKKSAKNGKKNGKYNTASSKNAKEPALGHYVILDGPLPARSEIDHAQLISSRKYPGEKIYIKDTGGKRFGYALNGVWYSNPEAYRSATRVHYDETGSKASGRSSMIGEKIKAGYFTAVYKPEIGGFRQEYVDATLEVISPGKARVITADMEQAGSKRQRYYVFGAESKEVGKIKIISKLNHVVTADGSKLTTAKMNRSAKKQLFRKWRK